MFSHLSFSWIFLAVIISGPFSPSVFSVGHSTILLQISYRLFELTNTLKTVFVPTRDNQKLLHNFIAGVVISVSIYCLSFILLQIPHWCVSSYTLLNQKKKKMCCLVCLNEDIFLKITRLFTWGRKWFLLPCNQKSVFISIHSMSHLTLFIILLNQHLDTVSTQMHYPKTLKTTQKIVKIVSAYNLLQKHFPSFQCIVDAICSVTSSS